MAGSQVIQMQRGLTMPIQIEAPRRYNRTKEMKSQKQAACIIGYNTLQARKSGKSTGRATDLRSIHGHMNNIGSVLTVVMSDLCPNQS